jgi:hypothetical protein
MCQGSQPAVLRACRRWPLKPARGAHSALFAAHAPENVVHVSGVTACHNILAMEHAGLHGSRLLLRVERLDPRSGAPGRTGALTAAGGTGLP